MPLNRKSIGGPVQYKGHTIQPKYIGPDLICEVDGQEIANFYLDAEAARNAGKRYVDQIEKEKSNG